MGDQEDLQELRRRLPVAESGAAELQAAEDALRQNEDKLRALFESIDEGFTIFEMVRDDQGTPPT